MKKSAKKKTHRSNCMKPNKLTAILGGISCILLIALIGMLLSIPEASVEVPVVETTVPTLEPNLVPTETEEATVPATEETNPYDVTLSGGEVEVEMLPEMAAYYERNEDFIGWIEIGDTPIDNPVMYTTGTKYKYLYRNFEGKYRYSGELFVDKLCTFEPESTTILIHGHNMNDGSMFNCLLNYKSQTYWEKHPTITFSTLYEERTYEIFAAFQDQILENDDGRFKYYDFINPMTEEEFNEGITYFKSNTKYDMGVDVTFGDRLLMLSTCDRTIAEGRFVVVAKLVTE